MAYRQTSINLIWHHYSLISPVDFGGDGNDEGGGDVCNAGSKIIALRIKFYTFPCVKWILMDEVYLH